MDLQTRVKQLINTLIAQTEIQQAKPPLDAFAGLNTRTNK
jgi:hypothetical protein